MSSSLSPRLSSSLQWTNLPEEFAEKVKSVFEKQFEIEADNGEFLVEGRIYPEELVVRIGYLEKGRLKQVNFEASMDRPRKSSETGTEAEQKASTLERLYVCIDFIGSIMEEYFDVGDEGEMDLPVRWKAFEFEEEAVYLQYSTVNTRLEEEADRLLGLMDPSLVHEETPSVDALGNADVDTELALAIQKAIRSGNYPGFEGKGLRAVDPESEENGDQDSEH